MVPFQVRTQRRGESLPSRFGLQELAIDMKRRDFTKAIAGIAAGVVAGTKVFADDAKKQADKAKASGCGGKDGCGGAKGKAAAAGDTAKHACKGMNECKGQGGCKTGDKGCAGKNSCKGKGGCSVPVNHGAPAKK